MPPTWLHADVMIMANYSHTVYVATIDSASAEAPICPGTLLSLPCGQAPTGLDEKAFLLRQPIERSLLYMLHCRDLGRTNVSFF
jgi:hypothetical protein